MIPKFWPQQEEGEGSHFFEMEKTIWEEEHDLDELNLWHLYSLAIAAEQIFQNLVAKNAKHLWSQFLVSKKLGAAELGASGSRSPMRLQSSLQLGLRSHLKAQLRCMGSAPSVCSHGFWQASVSPHIGLSTGLSYDIMAVGFPQGEWSKRELERVSTKVEVTAHPVCHTRFSRSESICPACPHPKKEDGTRIQVLRSGFHWMSVWQGHVGSWTKIWHLGDKFNLKVIIRKVLIIGC